MIFLQVLLFFLQAEDGIRDHCVTGVQTCALPILNGQRLIEDTDYTVIASDQFQLVHYIPKHWFDIVVDYKRDF